MPGAPTGGASTLKAEGDGRYEIGHVDAGPARFDVAPKVMTERVMDGFDGGHRPVDRLRDRRPRPVGRRDQAATLPGQIGPAFRELHAERIAPDGAVARARVELRLDLADAVLDLPQRAPIDRRTARLDQDASARAGELDRRPGNARALEQVAQVLHADPV